MKILALEFSSDRRSVAVVDRPARGASVLCAEVFETGGQGTHLLQLVERALREASVEREQIEVIAVGLGPGSYAGIRAAIALGQGWQVAREIKLIGISSVECLVAAARVQPWSGRLDLLIDAQRAEFYHAAYELGETAPRAVTALKLITMAEAQALAQPNATLAGPGITRWFSAAHDLFPRAADLGQLAADRDTFVSGEQLEPIYLRATSFVKAPPPRALPPAIAELLARSKTT
jgi:tRNA threonylcarbamoyladenosine biosynthesis protein TsaB